MSRNLGAAQLGGSGSGSPMRLETSYQLGLELWSSQDLTREDEGPAPRSSCHCWQCPHSHSCMAASVALFTTLSLLGSLSDLRT